MTKKILRIATRKSPLALWQAHHAGDALKKKWPGLEIEILPMVTSGDKLQTQALQAAGGKGLFVKELEEALIDKRADLAVHSMKDVPADLPLELGILAILARHNPFDALISKLGKPLMDLPSYAIVGTTSLRRQSQLLALRPDLKIKPLRGNINTRIDKLNHEDYDAIVLATAGLERIGLDHLISERLTEDSMLPACGQGALGIECRLDDLQTQEYIAPLNDSLTAICVHSERRVNAELGGNCRVPLAVFCASPVPDKLLLRAKVLSPDGQTVLANSQSGSLSESSILADRVVQELLLKGAQELLDGIHNA